MFEDLALDVEDRKSSRLCAGKGKSFFKVVGATLQDSD